MSALQVVESMLLFAVVALPLTMATAIAAPRLRERVIVLAPLAGLPALALALFGEPGATLEIPWLFKHTVLALDRTGKVFLGFTSVLYMTAAWYAASYLKRDPQASRFFALLLLAMAGNLGLIVAGDIPTFFAGFALMGLTSVGLVLHRGDAEARRAGRVYLALTMVGEVVILTGLAFLIINEGTTEIAELHQGAPNVTAMLLLLAGFGIKAGALTLHFWLPLAHPAAPIPASAVLSGTMIKAGLLGWMRFLPLGAVAIPMLGYTFLVAGLAAALLGALAGVLQNNPKTVLAYSSVCQVGILMTGLGIGALHPGAWPAILTAVLIYSAHHALAKGALFLGIGPAQAARTGRQIAIVRVGMVLPALALAGAPLTSGALAKVALKSNLEFLPDTWATALGLLLPLAAVGTTVMMIRFLGLVWPPQEGAVEARAEGLWAPWLTLVAALLVGVWLLPGALGWLSTKMTPKKIWLATWPLIVGGGLAALGARLRHLFSENPARWVPPGDVGVLVGRWIGRMARRVKERSPAEDGHEYADGPGDEEASSRFELAQVRRRLTAMETELGAWPVVGPTLLVGLAMLLWLLS
jgi:formate hydrogenlyase subunit 3/multisubunit Na+/H+ antiporter MnhD subunit